jgi:two-component system, sensor histidine kinase YesM
MSNKIGFRKVILITSMILLIILTTFVISSLWILNANVIESGILQEETRKYEYIAEDFSKQVNDTEIVLQNVENDSTFVDILSQTHSNYEEVEALYETIDFDHFFGSESEFFVYENLIIYTTNQSALVTEKIEYINQDVLQQEWYIRISSSRRKSVLFFIEQNAYILYKIEISEEVNDVHTHYGVVSLDLSFLQYSALKNYKIMFSNVSTNSIIDLYGDKTLEFSLNEYFGIGESTYMGNEIILSYVVISGSNASRWNLILVMQKPNYISDFARYAITVLSVILAIVFVVFYRINFVKKVDKSFNDLSSEKIQSIVNNSRPKRLDHIIQNLYLKIESLVKENQVLDTINQQKEVQKNEAEIKALLSQINPHYIFNMLNSIHKRALMNNETESAKMIILMSRQLRRSLDWKEPLVTVKSELDHIRSYIELQQYYHGSEYNIEYDLDQTLYELKIPKLMLQTLIENALKHGVETKPFYIKLDAKENSIRFNIKNEVTGNVKDAQDRIMHALNEELAGDDGDGIGLPNMVKRLKYYYGDDFSVSTHINKQTISIRIEFPKDIRR